MFKVIPQSFINKISFPADLENDCWMWAGKSFTKAGYGRVVFRFAGSRRLKAVYPHRLAYAIFKGPIPEGYVVMHSCDNPSCCNPNHLSVGTHTDNMQDCISKGRYSNGREKRTHCPSGHAYDQVNTYIEPKTGSRKCRACKKIQDRERYGRKVTQKGNPSS